MKKYGISQKEMLHILETHEVVYSDAAGVILVDEDSLICAQATDSKGLAGKCSAKALRSKKKLKTDSTTRGLTQKLSKQVIAVNEIVSHALSMLLGENERKVFLAFANQTDIYTIARLMSVNESTVLVILESAITKLNKQFHSWIHNLASKYEDSCYRNQLLTAQLERYTKVVDLYKQIVKVYKDQKRCDEERIKTLQSIFEQMEKIWGGQEHTNPFFPTKWMSALTNKLVAMKSHVIHFFHPAKDKVNSPADKQDQKKS